MRQTLRATTLVTAALAIAACSRQSTMDEAMKADLDAASTATLELAPRAQGTAVVSAIESKNPAQPRVAPVRRTTAPAQTPRRETPQVTQVARPEPTATRPSTTPAVQPPPPGGYKTINEVLRNAPFPIKP
jgi:hypothetical protein